MVPQANLWRTAMSDLEPEPQKNPKAEPHDGPRRAGRPPTHRTEQIRVRLSKEELDTITSNAKIASLKPATYLRHLGMRRHISNGKLDRDTQTEIWRQIAGIARNINQITKTYHIENRVEIEELKHDLEQIRALFFAIQNVDKDSDEADS
jgi:hypothetical protein